jgi:hypothetical protein
LTCLTHVGQVFFWLKRRALSETGIIIEIWQSFRRTPLWVQIWVALILVPVNLLPLAFWGEPYAVWITIFSIGGMLPNLVIMMVGRGLSKCMALPHLLIWTPLVVMLGMLLQSDLGVSDGFRTVLTVILLVDLLSLVFDYIDGWKWWRGDRAIA